MESLERLGRTISNGCIAQASVPNSLEEEYDVVLNFRGEDTRRNIADHLYLTLKEAQINVFMDDPSISFGEEIERKIFAAIERSRIAITIISEDYASSDHCLKELAHILKCMETGRLMVMPIFYKVKPSDIGSFRNSFQRIQSHIIKYPGTIVESWKEALKGIANMKGLLVDGVSYEGRIVRSIVENVEIQLKKSPKMNCNQRQERKRDMDHLVGIYEMARLIIEVISEDRNGVQTVGILGMGGMGKTTLARYIYNQLKHSFEFCSFVTTARQTFSGEVSVDRLISVILGQGSSITNCSNRGMNETEQFYYNKKVFIVLDDVDSAIEMSILMRMCTYFGSGSTIMVITRNRSVFENNDVRTIYELSGLAHDQAMQLFHQHTFGRRRPPDWTVKYTSRVLSTTGGHPLLIEVIGSSLLNKEEVEWESTLKKLENIPFECVQQKLLLCYKALDDNEKQLFLDIAFFPNGFDKQSLFLVLDSADTKALDTLEAMSLVKFDGDNKLYMHDLLRDLGRAILDESTWYLESLWSNESRCMPKGSKEVFESRPLTDEDAVTPTQLDEQSCSP